MSRACPAAAQRNDPAMIVARALTKNDGRCAATLVSEPLRLRARGASLCEKCAPCPRRRITALQFTRANRDATMQSSWNTVGERGIGVLGTGRAS